jgi:hypothetical protein
VPTVSPPRAWVLWRREQLTGGHRGFVLPAAEAAVVCPEFVRTPLVEKQGISEADVIKNVIFASFSPG